MQTLEIAQLTLSFRSLRIADPVRRARLASSLAEEGQRTPVVVNKEGETYTLIDGYARVEALRVLGKDLVDAIVLAGSVAAALALSHRLHQTRKVSAFEEAWLLKVLLEEYGVARCEVARQMERSSSWVSRRLALVEQLPISVQQAIRAAQISPQAAMRCLVPLARANTGHCERLVKNLGARRTSVRELQTIYDGYRSARVLVRERIVDAPLLWLRAAAVASPGVPTSGAKAHLPFDQLRRCCETCIRTLSECHEIASANPSALADSWTRACTSFDLLSQRMDDFYARLGHTDGHPTSDEPRPRATDDRAHPRDIAQHGPSGHPERPDGGAGRRAPLETERAPRAHSPSS